MNSTLAWILPVLLHRGNQTKTSKNNKSLFSSSLSSAEPILTEGSGDIRCWSDGWTVVTQDCGRCAQFVRLLTAAAAAAAADPPAAAAAAAVLLNLCSL